MVAGRTAKARDLAREDRAVGVEPFEASYGAGFEAQEDRPEAIECEVAEDGGDFAFTYACYVRVGMPGPWAGGWAGSARLEIPQDAGLKAAAALLDRAAAWLPQFATPLHRNARAPVNLTPVARLGEAPAALAVKLAAGRAGGPRVGHGTQPERARALSAEGGDCLDGRAPLTMVH